MSWVPDKHLLVPLRMFRIRPHFPSAHPQVDNNIPEENKFMWLGWDYINSNDVIIGNFETTISNGVEKSGFPKFNSPVKFLRDIKSNINFK